MSSRERWTVYPLLFLTLGIALKDKVTREITTEKVNCQTLLVSDREGHAQLTLRPTNSGGLINIHGHNGQGMLVGYVNPLFGILLTGPNGSLAGTALTWPIRTQPNPRAGAHPGGDKTSPTTSEPTDEDGR